MALAPCLLGYGAVAKMLHAHAATVREGNTYWDWIENYNADDYVEAVRLGSGACCPLVRFKLDVRLTLVAVELIEKNIRLQSPSRIEELVKIFVHATKVSFRDIFNHGDALLMNTTDGDWLLGNVSIQIDG